MEKKSLKEIKKYSFKEYVLGAIYVVILFAVVICFGYFWSEYKRKKIDDNGITAIGKVVELTYNEAPFAIVEYEVKKKIYRLQELSYSSIVGERYEVKYKISDPSEGYIKFDCPVFLPDEKTAFTMGTITNIGDKNQVSFEYNAEGNSYTRFQKLPNSVNVKKGEKYKVVYYTKDPKRSIIKINN